MSDLILSPEIQNIKKIENFKEIKIFTELKQGTPEWLKERAGVITWTWLKNVIVSRLKNGSVSATSKWKLFTYICWLIWWEFSYDENAPEVKTYLLQMWHEMEELAKIKYENKFWVKVSEVGFIKRNDWLWLSPDWIVFEEDWKTIKKAVEIKSPLWDNSKNFFKYVFENKIPDEYLWQAVHYFVVIDTLEELDFCVFNPNLIIENKQLWVITIKREDVQKYIDQAEVELLFFRNLWINAITSLIK